MKLTESQRKVIDHKGSPLLVTAGPGSGKTRVLVEKTISLVKSGHKKILALTFSNKAAEEILDRLKKHLTQEEMDFVNVGTFHSFCLELVLDRGNMIGLPASLIVLESEKDKIELLKKVLSDIEFQTTNEFSPQATLNKISDYKQKFKFPIEEDSSFIYIFEAYNNLLLEQRLIDFDDILFYAYRLLNEKPQVARMYNKIYKSVFIDEAQDLNEAQYSIIYSLCMELKNITMIGDEKQSIYGFNGSSSHYMMERFLKDFHPKHIDLKENFRSTKKIIKASQGIKNYEGNVAMYPLEGEVSIVQATNESSEAEWVTKKIFKLVDNGSEWVEGPLSFQNIAILARNRYVFQELEKSLKQYKVPYNFRTTTKLLESVTLEMQIFENGLKFMTNPYNQITRKNLEEVILFDEDSTANNSEVLLHATLRDNIDIPILLFESIIKAWKTVLRDNESFMRALMEIENAIENLNENDYVKQNLELLLKDIEMWKKHWRQYCTLTVAGNRNLIHFKNQMALGKTTYYNHEGVTLSTVHMAKGLEYDIVFIIGMCEGLFPDYRATNPIQLLEEQNNMFVALTRAKRVCYLSFPEYRFMPWGSERRQTPSRYLRDIKKGLEN